jgi:hypothetical protein
MRERKMPNLIEAIQERCNELREEYIPAYESIGPAGMFGVAMMKMGISRAEEAIATGDTVGMVAALQELREFKL